MHHPLRWPFSTRPHSRFLARFLAPLLLLVLLLGGCTNPEGARLFEQLAAQNGAILAAQGADPTNRLLVQGVDGNLFTMRPDGSDRIALTNDATSRRQYLQPTWSPTGNKIAWAEVDNRTGDLKSALVVSNFDGLAREYIETPFAPFYMHWSPDESHLAYLSNWLNLNQSTATIALRLVDFAATDARVRTLAEGQPLYLTWSPGGERLLIHVDNDRLEFWDVAGEGASLTPTFAAFPAPQWSGDGSNLLYAIEDGTSQQLVLADTEGNLAQEITDFEGQITFGLSPTGEQIAYAITERGLGTAAFGPLYLVEVASKRTRELSAMPVMAFFWSPDGTKLAYLSLDDSGPTWRLRWHVWDGTRNTAYAPMVPTGTFLQGYLAFFDQYARSMSIWSPDSTAFAYAAIDDTVGNHIWVQQLDEAEPTRITRGLFVAWSPR
jgi:TolB protein